MANTECQRRIRAAIRQSAAPLAEADGAQSPQLRMILSQNCFPLFRIAAACRDDGAPVQDIFYFIC
jgi:hypothetical protein